MSPLHLTKSVFSRPHINPFQEQKPVEKLTIGSCLLTSTCTRQKSPFTHTQTHRHAHSTLSHTHSYTHSLTHTFKHTLLHTLIQVHTCSLSHTSIHMYSLTHTYTQIHTHTQLRINKNLKRNTMNCLKECITIINILHDSFKLQLYFCLNLTHKIY